MSRHRGINWAAQPLGREPDLAIARRLGVVAGSVRSARVARGIPAFPRGTVERLGAVGRLRGPETDRELADEIGCSEGEVREARRRHGVPSTLRFLDWDSVPLGETWDSDIAMRFGVSVTAVCDARQRRGIPRYAPERECACGEIYRASVEAQTWCSAQCGEAASDARLYGREGELVDLYVARRALMRDLREVRR